VDSKERSVVGRLVFTKGIAPGLVSRIQGSGNVNHTCILQQPDHGTIFSVGLSSVLREADRNIETSHLYRVLQRHGYSSQRALEIDLLPRPFFSLGEEYFGQTVCLLVCLDGDLSIGTQDIDGTCYLLVDILNEILDGFAQNRAFLR
jgi:hypothetical protein